MSNKQLSDETIKSIKDIHNKSVRLLELLNVLIPKVDSIKAIGLTETLMGEVSDIAFELGTELVMIKDQFEEKDPWLDEHFNPLGM
jgi:hypothetical protein